MRSFYTTIVNNPKKIMAIFFLACLICLGLRGMVAVNYDINDYLPEDSPSTVAIDVMEAEFTDGIPNGQVMLKGVTVPEALSYKEKLEDIDGVSNVTWLDDSVDATIPMETMDQNTVETYYKDGNALFTLTIEEDKRLEAVNQIKETIDGEGVSTGSAVSIAAGTESTVKEVRRISIGAVLFALLVLIITTCSWAEPFIILTGLGVAVIINTGTNIIFGEISFVTNAAGSILQLAVSLDYSVFLIHRYQECRSAGYGKADDSKSAMVEALCRSTGSILSSGATTVAGFLALVFMRYEIGADLGLALAKAVVISLLTIFVFMPVFILSMSGLMERSAHRSFLPDFGRFGRFVAKVMVPMVVVFLIAVVPSYMASNGNYYYYGDYHIFGTDTQFGQERQEIEQTFGKQDTYALMVPKGNRAAEEALSGKLHQLERVTDVISYVDTVGVAIPADFLEQDTLSKLESDRYSRMIITVRTDYEGEEAFALVEDVRAIAEDAYGKDYYLAGSGVSTYDLMDTITADTLKINLAAILAIYLVLLLLTRSLILPLLLVASIEMAIWVNLAIPYFMGTPVFYIAYLIIGSVQLGATVDYAILFTDRYREYRRTMAKRKAIVEMIRSSTASVLTSGSVFVVVGFLLGAISSHGVLSQLGIFLGRGGLCSLFMVFFVLPGLLYCLDGLFIKKKKSHSFLQKVLAEENGNNGGK
ncbi:MAG: MMPL family transporter [Bacillota bacterium]|nr:MMPL family transporter [Bacillota bacterium]